MERGDNHQTIHAATDQDKFIQVMESFITRFEECNPTTAPDDSFDLVIDLDPIVGSRQNLETVVTELHKSIPGIVTELPSPEQLDEAIEVALGYKPDFKHIGVKGCFIAFKLLILFIRHIGMVIRPVPFRSMVPWRNIVLTFVVGKCLMSLFRSGLNHCSFSRSVSFDIIPRRVLMTTDLEFGSSLI